MTQWTYLLKNLGSWEGHFTHLTAEGELIDNVPSQVSLEGLDNHQQICQTVQMLSLDRQTVVSERVLNYRSLSRSVLVFETGAFSQGSMQYGPFSEFGAELGFIEGDRRLRVVQLFDKQARLSKLTLIREYRQGTQSPEFHQPNADPLHIDDVLGQWQGTATTLFPDLSPPQTVNTQRIVQQTGDRRIHESTTHESSVTDDIPKRTWWLEESSPKCTRLRSTNTQTPFQSLLLPGQTWSTTPLSIPRQQSFTLEAGWLVSPAHCQRMIRHYDTVGAWTALTLVFETKV
jgi:hypothetical protein